MQSAMLCTSKTYILAIDQAQPSGLAVQRQGIGRQICSIRQEDVATVRARTLPAKLELEDLDLFLRERAGLEMSSILVGQSEQHVIYRLVESTCQACPT